MVFLKHVHMMKQIDSILSGTKANKMLRNKERPPIEFSRGTSYRHLNKRAKFGGTLGKSKRESYSGIVHWIKKEDRQNIGSITK